MRDFLSYFHNNKELVLFDGAMGTELYRRGIYINQCFESLNLSRPELILQIHQEYIQAGAEVLEANIYGANTFKLQKFGYEYKLEEIIGKGIEIARNAAGEDAFVAAAIGPSGKILEPYGNTTDSEIQESFTRQLKCILDNEPDILLFETFTYLRELRIILDVLQELKPAQPVICQLVLGDNGHTAYGDSLYSLQDLKEQYNIFAIGMNCGLGPRETWEYLREFRKNYDGYLSAQPNAGYPRIIEGRMMYMASPEYFAEYAKRLAQIGVNLVGACCGSDPEHIKGMKSALLAVKPRQPAEKTTRIEPVYKKPEKKAARKTPVPSEKRSGLAAKLAQKKFVKSVEIDPPKGTSIEKVMKAARDLKSADIDAINIADGPRATCRMSPFALALHFQNNIGIEPILHYCCRDRNILGIQSDLLGAHSLGLRNLLLVTGDPPKLGDYPFATAVFDIDSIGLTHIVSELNHGVDIAGNDIGEPTSFFLGVGANPGAIDIDKEVERFKYKVRAGAQYVLTQPVYDVALLEQFLDRIQDFRIPVLVGILPLVSSRNAEFLHNEVPGMQIPEPILRQMHKAGKGPEAVQTGIKIAGEALAASKDLVEGVYIMPPFGRHELALQILQDI